MQMSDIVLRHALDTPYYIMSFLVCLYLFIVSTSYCANIIN